MDKEIDKIVDDIENKLDESAILRIQLVTIDMTIEFMKKLQNGYRNLWSEEYSKGYLTAIAHLMRMKEEYIKSADKKGE